MTINVAIIDDHQSIVDGYLYRLNLSPDIKVVSTVATGSELEPMLNEYPVDVLLMDIHIPITRENKANFQLLPLIPKLLKKYPKMRILVISMTSQVSLIQAFIDAGVSGYIYKDDHETIQILASIVNLIASGGFYCSPELHQQLRKSTQDISKFTRRELEVLTVVSSHPELTTDQIAQKMNVSGSTVRNCLGDIYSKLGVHSRAAAMTKAQKLGLISQNDADLSDEDFDL